jgi:site-specific DNA recombinase
MHSKTEIAEHLTCYHCGEDCADDHIHIQEKYFCCEGCKMVYEIINQNGLCTYYEIKKNPGIAQKVKIREGKFAFLDDKAVEAKLVHFSQPIDTNSHAGALQQNIQFIFSKYDNDLRRQKTIDGMREKLLRGEWIGNAPTGYSFVKGAPTQTIVINEKGEAMKQAFMWRANGMTYDQIIAKLKPLGVTLPKQTLTDIFRNPFYCGFMSHNLLNGEVIKGKHPALIDEDLFLRANELKKTDGYTSNKANDNLPLKVFVKEAETNTPFTGYLVKKMGLYYYKVNKVGIKINRSTKIMHDKFKELLANYTIDASHIEPLKIQLQYTWENLTENNSSEKKALSNKLNEVEEEFYNLRKRHATGTVSLDIYEEFSVEMKVRKEALLAQLEMLDQKLSNPKELIHFTCKLASNLAPVWDSGDYYQKQLFQNVLFPKGLLYDVKMEHYRTPIVNSVIACIADLSKDSYKIKKPDSLNLLEKSGSVPGTGLEPVRLLRSQDFKHYATLQKPTFQYKIKQKEDKIAHFYCTPIIIKN